MVRLFWYLPVPPLVIPFLTDEENNSMYKCDGLIYSVDVPAMPTSGDLVSQELCVHFWGGEESIAVDPTGGVTNFMVPQDADVSIHLIYKDDGGNKAEGPLFTFKAVDTINTFAPPGFGDVALVEEVFEAYEVEEKSEVIEDDGVTESPVVEGEEDPSDDETESEVENPQGPTI